MDIKEIYRKIDRSLEDISMSILNGESSILGLVTFQEKYLRELDKAKFGKRRYAVIYPDTLESLMGEYSKKETPTYIERSAILPLKRSLRTLFSMSAAYDLSQSTRAIGILFGGIGLAAAAEYFGIDVDLVEAHRQTSPKYKGIDYKEDKTISLRQKDKVLLLEDAFYDTGSDRTYDIVYSRLLESGLPKENISVFVDNPGNLSQLFGPVLPKSKEELNQARADFSEVLDRNIYFSIRPLSAISYPERWRLLTELAEGTNVEDTMSNFNSRIKGKIVSSH